MNGEADGTGSRHQNQPRSAGGLSGVKKPDLKESRLTKGRTNSRSKKQNYGLAYMVEMFTRMEMTESMEVLEQQAKVRRRRKPSKKEQHGILDLLGQQHQLSSDQEQQEGTSTEPEVVQVVSEANTHWPLR